MGLGSPWYSLFCMLQVELYAEYAPSQLLAFLVSSQSSRLEAALELCEARSLVREQVFILGRMGSAAQALHLIIQRLADVPQVSFPPTPLHSVGPWPSSLLHTCMHVHACLSA